MNVGVLAAFTGGLHVYLPGLHFLACLRILHDALVLHQLERPVALLAQPRAHEAVVSLQALAVRVVLKLVNHLDLRAACSIRANQTPPLGNVFGAIVDAAHARLRLLLLLLACNILLDIGPTRSLAAAVGLVVLLVCAILAGRCRCSVRWLTFEHIAQRLACLVECVPKLR